MTIGSPIDKHIALWPALWREFAFTTVVDQTVLVRSARDGARPVLLEQPIKWRNYFDYGDPIGFRLDEARRTLVEDISRAAFEFETAEHDFGFSRYWLPGTAHVNYWRDPDLFRHFIDTVVKSPPDLAAAPPANRVVRHHVAQWIPYLLAYAMHGATVLVLLQALALLGPALGLGATSEATLVLGTLLLAVTVAARVPRLTRPESRWAVLAALEVGIGAAGMRWLPDGLAAWAGRIVSAAAPDIG